MLRNSDKHDGVEGWEREGMGIQAKVVICQFSCSVVSDSLWPPGLQHTRIPCLSPSPGICSDSCPSSRWCHLIICHLCHPLFLLPSVFPSIWVLLEKSVLRIRWPEYWSFSISPSSEYSVLISSRMDWLDLLAVQGTQESSLTQQFSSSALTFLYSPTITSIHYYWKNQSFDYMDICWRSNISAF